MLLLEEHTRRKTIRGLREKNMSKNVDNGLKYSADDRNGPTATLVPKDPGPA